MVERTVIYTLINLIIDKEFLKRVYRAYVDKYSVRDEEIKKQISSIDDEINKVTIKRDRLLDLYEDGIVPKQELESRTKSRTETITDLQNQRTEISTQLSGAANEAEFQTFSEFTGGFRDTVLEFDAEQFRELLRLLNSRIVIQPGTRNATFHLSAATGLLSTSSTHCGLRLRQLRGHVSHVPDPGSRHSLCRYTCLQELHLAVQLSRFE